MPRLRNYIPYEDIEKEAKEFLDKYHPSDTIPIPIEEIIEQKLDFSIIPSPSLQDSADIDAWISIKTKEIYIDKDMYSFNTRRYLRARFTFAHEIGHMVLHSDLLNSLDFKSVDDWTKFILENQDQYDKYETQANNFSGCILMPAHHLRDKFNDAKERIIKSTNNQSLNELPDEMIASFAARNIARAFEVSEKSAEIRLLKWIRGR